VFDPSFCLPGVTWHDDRRTVQIIGRGPGLG
jgi:hypothetical protein